MSGIRQLGATTKANNASNNNGAQKQQTQYTGNNDRREEQDLRDDMETIRSATANPFGERSRPTALLTQLAKYAKTYIEGRNRIKGYRMEVVIVEKDVGVPGIVISNVTETEDENKIKFDMAIGHIIMLADYTQRPDAIGEWREGNRTVTEPTVWAQALDSDYYAAIEEAFLEQTNIEKVMFVDAGVTAYNIADLPVAQLMQDNQGQNADLDNLFFNAMTVAEAIRAIEAGETNTAIRPELIRAGNEIVADINLVPQTSITAGNLPVAEDFRIVVKEVKQGSRYDRDEKPRHRSLNNKSDSKSDLTYGGVGGRIDFMYVIPRIDNGYIREPRREDSACFIPEFIASSFDMYDRAPSLSLISQLMASVGMLGDRNPPIFLAAFKPDNVVNTPSRNLGALAAKLKDPKTGKTEKRAEFRPNMPESEFYDFAECAILPDFRIGMEVPTQGPLVKLLEVFFRAALYAAGDDNSASANAMLIDSWDQLTGGLFSAKWGTTNPVMEAEIVTIPGGYWTDERGLKRDSREILNYTYLANLENPKEALDMSDDYLASFTTDSWVVGANKRLDLISQVKGKNFVQTDNFQRVYFAADAYLLLLECMIEAKTSVRTPRMNFGGVNDDRRRIDSVGGRIARDSLHRGYKRFDNYGNRDNNNNDYSSGRGRFFGGRRNTY